MTSSLLARILNDKFDAEELSIEEIPAIMIEFAAAFTEIVARVMAERSNDESRVSANKLLTVSDAAQTLTMSPRTVRQLARQNKLAGFQRTKGGPWYFQPSAIDEYLQQETGVTTCIAPSQSQTRKRTRRRPLIQKRSRRNSLRANRAVERIQMEPPKGGPAVPFDYSELQIKR